MARPPHAPPKKRRRRSARAHAASVGLSPGEAIYTGDVEGAALVLRGYRYHPGGLELSEGIDRVSPRRCPTG